MGNARLLRRNFGQRNQKLTTTVNNLVCKLGNIKATVGLSADLDSLFKPDDETDKLTVTLSIQDNSLVYGRPEATGETLKPGSSAQSIRTTP